MLNNFIIINYFIIINNLIINHLILINTLITYFKRYLLYKNGVIIHDYPWRDPNKVFQADRLKFHQKCSVDVLDMPSFTF